MARLNWDSVKRNPLGYEQAQPRGQHAIDWKALAASTMKGWLGEDLDPRCEEVVDLQYGRTVRVWRPRRSAVRR